MTTDPQNSRTLEEEATLLLTADAKKNHTTLYREGIIDDRRRRMINRREIPFSVIERKRNARQKN